MRYRLLTQPTVGPGKVTEELARLLAHARRLTTRLVVVGPPHKHVRMTASILDVPDAVAPMATRVLEVILGNSGSFQEHLIPPRPEWARHALLTPQKGAAPLVETLFDDWSSMSLSLHWTPGRCVGVIDYCEGDAARVRALAGHGWRVAPLPGPARAALAALWRGRVSHGPFLGRPLVTPAVQAPTPAPAGAASAAVTIFSEPQESVFAPGAASPPPRPARPARPTAIGTVLAPPRADGFPLGTTRDGQAVRLAWNALQLSVVAPEAPQRSVVLTMIARALQHDMGLVAVIPQHLLSTRQLSAWSTRVRMLDPRDKWQSQAIPWHLIDTALLRTALADAGVTASLPDLLPATFGELLAAVPGGAQYCTESVLALTAPGGDDLRGVVRAGGGVVLIDEASPGSRLLGMLLLALLASDPPIDRRLLIIRPAQMVVPPALGRRAIQIVLGEDRMSLGALHFAQDHWRLVHADGSAPTALDADLDRAPTALDESSYSSLLATLEGAPGDDGGAVPAGADPLAAAAPLFEDVALPADVFAPPPAGAAASGHATPVSAPAPTAQPADAVSTHVDAWFAPMPSDQRPDAAAPAPAPAARVDAEMGWDMDAGDLANAEAGWAVSDCADATSDGTGGGMFDAVLDVPLAAAAMLSDSAAAAPDDAVLAYDPLAAPLDDAFAAPSTAEGDPFAVDTFAADTADAATWGSAGGDLFDLSLDAPVDSWGTASWSATPDLAGVAPDHWTAPAALAGDAPVAPDMPAIAPVSDAPAGPIRRRRPSPAHPQPARGHRVVRGPARPQAGAPAEEPAASDAGLLSEPGGDAGAPPLTLALAAGDLDLSATPLFEGPEFELALAPASDFDLSAAPLFEGPAFEPALALAEDQAPAVQDVPAAGTAADVVVAALAANAQNRIILGDELDATSDGHDVGAQDVPAAVPAADGARWALWQDAPAATGVNLPDSGSLALDTSPAGAAVPARQAASVDLAPATAPVRIDDEAALRVAWREGSGLGDLVDRVARANPGVDRGVIRRAVRAVIDAPAALAPVVDTPAAALAPVVDTPAAALAPVVDTLRKASARAGEAWPAPVVDTPAAALAPVVDAPAASVALVVDTLGAPHDDAQIWRRWLAGDDVGDIVRDLCGYRRGRVAEETREHVYGVVVPRIVAELGADAIVARLLDGREPLRAQIPLYDELLRRLNRQSAPVAGVIRGQAEARLVAAMRAARRTAAKLARERLQQ